MGRRAKFDGTQVSIGHGKKVKKQNDPTFPKGVLVKEISKLSHRQKQRAQKRLLKNPQLKEDTKILLKKKTNPKEEQIQIKNEKNISKKLKKKEEKKFKSAVNNNYHNEDDNEEADDNIEDGQMKQDEEDADNQSLFAPKLKKAKKKFVNNVESDSEEMIFSNEEEVIDEQMEHNEETDDDDDDPLPIEKANKKLKKKKQEEEKLAQEEMDNMIAHQSIFSFPTEEELANVTNLKDIQQRIRDIIIVLSDFKRLRVENRSRSEYIELLRRDLCTYYSYNDFLMEKLMQMFSLDELLEFLEASEVERPMTIRTNTLKTRRRDLAE
ncbi:ribosomal rna methyltransferase nop2-like protein, partial [Lasius niger]